MMMEEAEKSQGLSPAGWGPRRVEPVVGFQSELECAGRRTLVSQPEGSQREDILSLRVLAGQLMPTHIGRATPHSACPPAAPKEALPCPVQPCSLLTASSIVGSALCWLSCDVSIPSLHPSQEAWLQKLPSVMCPSGSSLCVMFFCEELRRELPTLLQDRGPRPRTGLCAQKEQTLKPNRTFLKVDSSDL